MRPADLEQLYDDHAQAMFAFLLNLTRDESDTRDILQEVFQQLATRPEILDGVREVRAYLLRLSHNRVIDLIRRRITREKHASRLMEESPLFAPSSFADETAFRHALQEALGQLPPDQRAVVHLKLWEELTFERIAETLEIPLNTAASRYRYGLDKLREHLRPLYDEIK